MKKLFIFSVAAICLSATVHAQVDTTKRDTTKRKHDSTSVQHPISLHRNTADLRTASKLSLTSFTHDAILERKSLANMKKQEEVTA